MASAPISESVNPDQFATVSSQFYSPQPQRKRRYVGSKSAPQFPSAMWAVRQAFWKLRGTEDPPRWPASNSSPWNSVKSADCGWTWWNQRSIKYGWFERGKKYANSPETTLSLLTSTQRVFLVSRALPKSPRLCFWIGGMYIIIA